jgi:hypothetical protein
MTRKPESKVKLALREAVEAEGWDIRTPSWGVRKWPDHIILAGPMRVAFVESKHYSVYHSQRHLAGQARVRNRLHDEFMIPVFKVDKVEDVPLVIQAIKNEWDLIQRWVSDQLEATEE